MHDKTLPNFSSVSPAALPTTQPTRRIQVRRSGVHGKGVYAVVDIPAGERLIEYTGEIISWEEALARHPHRPLGRDRLLALAYGPGHSATDRSIDVQVMRLRKLIEADPAQPRHLRTVWGVGYVFVPDASGPGAGAAP